MPEYTIFIAIALLRFVMGLRFVFPGWMMIQMGPFAAKGYLENVQGPFANSFKKLAINKAVDCFNKWGLFLIGLALVLGVFVGLASFLGMVLMILYWFSKWPWQEGIIDERIVNVAVLIFLIMVQAGLFIGFDYLLLQIPVISEIFFQYAWFRWII